MARNSIIKAVITGDTQGLDRALGRSESALGSFGRKATIAFAGVTAGITAAAVAAKPLIDAASDLNEAASKSDQVFRDASDSVAAFADTAAVSFGISKTQALDSAASFAAFGRMADLSGEDLASFSTNLVGVAADLASFNNISTDDALQKLRSGLAGQTEPLLALGIDLRAATVNAKALEMGLGGLNGELSEGERVMARQALILEQLGDQGALGDFARTSDGLANQQKILAARFSDVQAELGQKLLPVAIEAAGVALDLIDKFEGLANMLSEHGVAGSIDILRDRFEWFDTLADIIGDAVTAAQRFWDRFGDDIIATAQTIWDGIRTAVDGIVAVLNGLIDLIVGVWTGDWGRAWDGIAGIFTGALDVIQSALRIARAWIELTFEIMVNAIKKLWDLNFLSDVFDTVAGAIVDAAQAFGRHLVEAIKNGVLETPNAIKDALLSVIPDPIKDFLGGGSGGSGMADLPEPAFGPGTDPFNRSGGGGFGGGFGVVGGITLEADGVAIAELVNDYNARAGVG